MWPARRRGQPELMPFYWTVGFLRRHQFLLDFNQRHTSVTFVLSFSRFFLQNATFFCFALSRPANIRDTRRKKCRKKFRSEIWWRCDRDDLCFASAIKGTNQFRFTKKLENWAVFVSPHTIGKTSFWANANATGGHFPANVQVWPIMKLTFW